MTFICAACAVYSASRWSLFQPSGWFPWLQRPQLGSESESWGPTLAGSAVGGWSEAHLTLAAIRTGDVEALSVLTKIYVFCTLIDIWGREQITSLLNSTCHDIVFPSIITRSILAA